MPRVTLPQAPQRLAAARTETQAQRPIGPALAAMPPLPSFGGNLNAGPFANPAAFNPAMANIQAPATGQLPPFGGSPFGGAQAPGVANPFVMALMRLLSGGGQAPGRMPFAPGGMMGAGGPGQGFDPFQQRRPFAPAQRNPYLL